MRKMVIRSTVMLLSLASTTMAENPRERWIDSFDAAQTEAKKSGKPIFLVFR